MQVSRIEAVQSEARSEMYYVYLLIDPRTEQPFYVGKGKAGRMLAHEEEAIEGKQSPKHDRIRGIRAAELKVRYEIDDWFTNEEDAFRRESELIASHSGLLNIAGNEKGHEKPRIRFLDAFFGMLAKTERAARARQAVRILRIFPYEAMPDENHRKLWQMTFTCGWKALHGR